MSNSSPCDYRTQNLSLHVRRDDDGFTVEITLKARHDDFCIRGSALFDLKNLFDRLESFRKFPISEENLLEISGGYFSNDGSVLNEKHVSISVRPIGNTGNLIMAVEAFSPDDRFLGKGLGRGGRCDYHLSYEGLNDFVNRMRDLLKNDLSVLEFSNFDHC